MKTSSVGTKELRNFGLVTGALFVFVFGLILPWTRHHAVPFWPWLLGSLLCSCALLAPRSLKWIFIVWRRVGVVLGWINSRIVLTAIFFFVMVPTGFLLRLFREDPMARTMDPDSPTYRILADNLSRENMERPF
jgi:Saxitoxin biosynthesis operon protein SxtJ